MNIFLLILYGIIGGVVGGMGMGGGTLLIPLLVLCGGFEQHIAQSINLLVFLPMSCVALAIHFKNKLVKWKQSFIIILPAIASAILGSFLATNIQGDNLKLYFGIFLAILGILQFISVFVCKNDCKTKLLPKKLLVKSYHPINKKLKNYKKSKQLSKK